MKEYIFGERNGIYIIDLQKTLKMFKKRRSSCRTWRMTDARAICRHQAPGAGRDCRRSAKVVECSTSTSAGWGTAHQLVTVQKSVKRLKELDEMATDGRYELLPKKK